MHDHPSRSLPARALGAAFTLLTIHCGASPHAGGESLRPIDELRAIVLINEALESAGFTGAPGSEEVFGDKKVQIDVWVEGGQYGIAYVDSVEEGKIGGDLPKAKDHMLPLLP